MGVSRRVIVSLVAAFVTLAPVAARANPYDISLRGLGRPESQSLGDPAVKRYRQLSTELALALAPRPLAPAETLGMSGFEFSVASTLSDITQTAPYWQGQPGTPIMEGVLPNHGGGDVPDSLWLTTAHLRKGLPLSSEVGISGTYVAFTKMFMVGAEAKIALYESFFRHAPALSARVAVARLLGSDDLDLTTGEVDVMASLAFGVGGMIQVTPYLGYGQLYAHVNSQVLDETPYAVTDAANDQRGGAGGSLYTFPTLEWKSNRYQRAFGGMRFNIGMIEISYEFNAGLSRPSKNKWLGSHSVKLGFDV